MDVGIMIKKGEHEIPYLGENNISDDINHDMNGKRKRKKKAYSPDNNQHRAANQLQQELLHYPRICNMNPVRIMRLSATQIHTCSYTLNFIDNWKFSCRVYSSYIII